jgi:hypothetical protein
MKNSIVLFFLLFSVSAFAQFEIEADTLFSRQTSDTTHTVYLAKTFIGVSTANLEALKKARLQNRLEQLSNLEKQIKEARAKLLQDSTATAGVINDEDLNELFNADLSIFYGDWNFTIDDKKEKVSVDSLGRFVVKKGDIGQIEYGDKMANKILIKLKNKKYPLRRNGDPDLYINESKSIIFQRAKNEKKR